MPHYQTPAQHIFRVRKMSTKNGSKSKTCKTQKNLEQIIRLLNGTLDKEMKQRFERLEDKLKKLHAPIEFAYRGPSEQISTKESASMNSKNIAQRPVSDPNCASSVKQSATKITCQSGAKRKSSKAARKRKRIC